MSEFKKLFKKNVDGSIQEWSVSVEANVIATEFGRMGGSIQANTDVIKSGKNIGKKNETTPESQALLKAQQIYDKKLKQGYTPDLELAQSSDNILDGIKPMLAHPIEKKEKHVQYPALAQPKLDGMRCLAIIENFKCTLYSRTQKLITTLPHIVAQLEAAVKKENIPNIVLDGELYNHEHKENFNRLMSLIKRDEVHADCEEIEYHIYDVVDLQPYFDRTKPVEKIAPHCKNVFKLEGVLVESKDELTSMFHNYLSQGYEGAMYRNPSMDYENKRSSSLLKVKIMQDEEFKIIDVVEGNGKLAGHAGSFVCETKEGKTFKAKLKGELDSLVEYYVNFEKYRGRDLTVQFQGLTPDLIPRFPVGLRLREAE